MFTPLRRRIPEWIDWRFYRQRYNAERILAVFGTKLRNAVDLDQLSSHLLEVVQESLHPEHVSLWLKRSGHMKSLLHGGIDKNREGL